MRLSGSKPRIIGLSATVGDPESVGRLLSECSGRRTVIPKIEAGGVKWRLSMEHFFGSYPEEWKENIRHWGTEIKKPWHMSLPPSETDKEPEASIT